MNAALPASKDNGAGTTTAVLRTLVLCDLVDSTAMVERLGDQRAADLFRKHDRFARSLVQQYGGREIDKTDGFLILFERPIQAVAFALAYQREIAALNTAEGAQLAARFGIHVGDVMMWDNAALDVSQGAKQTEVEGLVKPVTARLMQLALPGQILLSNTAYEIAHRAQGELGAALALVRWRTHGRYRFKGVPDPVAVFEVGEEGLAPLKPPPWSGKAHRELPFWKRPATIVAEALLVLALVAIPLVYLLRPQPAIAFAQRDWVVVGDVKNLTGQTQFDNSLQTAFRVGLEQSRYVNVIPDMQLRASLKRMERDPAATPIDRAVGSEIAVRENARALILPTIAEVGGRVRITAEVVDPNTQTSVYSDSVDGVGMESVLPTMDELLRKMRGRLGESISAIGATSAPLAQITTANLDALRALAKSEEAYGRGKINDSMLLLQEALRLDPKFALAWTRLSTIQNAYLNDPKAAYASLQSAQSNKDRLSAREQLFLEGTVAQFENANTWIDKWTVATQLYPDSVPAQQNLGLGHLWYAHRPAESLPNFSAVANSRHPLRGLGWYSLAVAETERGNDALAMSYVAKGHELGTIAPHFEEVAADLAARRYPAVLGHLQGVAATLPNSVQAEKHLRLAAVAIDQGHDDDARASLDEAAKLGATTPSLAQHARIALARAALDLAGAKPEASGELDDLIAAEAKRATDAGPSVDGSAAIHLALAAMLAARSGDVARARVALDAARSSALDHGYYDRGALWRSADCETQFAQDAEKRVACLVPLVDGREYFQTHVALLLAYRERNAEADVKAQSAWLQQHRGQAVAELENEAAQIPNLIALRTLAPGPTTP